jgi:hypothetical protein
MVKSCVFFAVRTGFLNIIQTSFGFKWLSGFVLIGWLHCMACLLDDSVVDWVGDWITRCSIGWVSSRLAAGWLITQLNCWMPSPPVAPPSMSISKWCFRSSFEPRFLLPHQSPVSLACPSHRHRGLFYQLRSLNEMRKFWVVFVAQEVQTLLVTCVSVRLPKLCGVETPRTLSTHWTVREIRRYCQAECVSPLLDLYPAPCKRETGYRVLAV